MEVQTYDVPGIGRQQCPKCLKWVDDDIGICQCGFNFTTPNQAEVLPEIVDRKQVAPKRAEKKSSFVPPSRISFLRIPDGSNPVPLKGRDKATLLKWAADVRAYWLTRGYFLMVEGLCYYLLWEPQFDDKKKAREAAEEILVENLSDEKP